MMGIIRNCWRGMGKIEGYGEHPGTPWMLFLLLLGLLMAGWIGLLVISLVFGPVYLYGAYMRGKAGQDGANIGAK